MQLLYNVSDHRGDSPDSPFASTCHKTAARACCTLQTPCLQLGLVSRGVTRPPLLYPFIPSPRSCEIINFGIRSLLRFLYVCFHTLFVSLIVPENSNMSHLPDSLRVQSQHKPLSAATVFDVDLFLNGSPEQNIGGNGYAEQAPSKHSQRHVFPADTGATAGIETDPTPEALVPRPLFAARKSSDPTSDNSLSSTLLPEKSQAPAARPVSAVRLLPSQQRALAAQYTQPPQRARQGRPLRRPVSSAIDLDFQVPPTPVSEPLMQLPFAPKIDVPHQKHPSPRITDDKNGSRQYRQKSEERPAKSQGFSIQALPLSLTVPSRPKAEVNTHETHSTTLSTQQEPTAYPTKVQSPQSASRRRALSSNDLSREFSVRPNPWAAKPIAPDRLHTSGPSSSCPPSREPSLPRLARQPLSIRRKKFAQDFDERTSRSSSRSSSQASSTRAHDEPSQFPVMELPGSTTFAKDDIATRSAASETKHAILDLYLRSPGDELEGYYFTVAVAGHGPRNNSAPARGRLSPTDSLISPTEAPSSSSLYTPWNAGPEGPRQEGVPAVYRTDADQPCGENASRTRVRKAPTPPPGVLSPPLTDPSPQLSPPPPYINAGSMMSPPLSPPRSPRPRLHLETTLHPQNQRSRSADPVLLRGPAPMGDDKSKLQQEYKQYYQHYAEGTPPPPASLHPAFAHRNDRAPPSYQDAELHMEEQRRREWDMHRQEQKKREDAEQMRKWATARQNQNQHHQYQHSHQHQQQQQYQPQYQQHYPHQHPHPHQHQQLQQHRRQYPQRELEGPQAYRSEQEERHEAEWERDMRDKTRGKQKRIARLKGTGFGVGAIEAVSAVARILG